MKPFFVQLKLPALAIGANILYSINITEGGLLKTYSRFTPFRNLTAVNMSPSQIEIMFDFNPERIIFASNGGAPASHNQPYTNFLVTNVGGNNINANQIRIWL